MIWGFPSLGYLSAGFRKGFGLGMTIGVIGVRSRVDTAILEGAPPPSPEQKTLRGIIAEDLAGYWGPLRLGGVKR